MVEARPQDIVTISIEAKARLARLLASENIYVEHRNVPTAAFDIKNRVLILPNWKDISKEVYDLLVLHEVGHALYTPLDGWHGAVSGKGERFKGFLNVLEDARIEKKIKRKFPGGRKSFTQGYADLLKRDFFGIGDRDISSFGFIDRINMFFKGGSAMGITFPDAEQVFVDRIEKAETWEEVEALANELWDMAKDEVQTDKSAGPEPQRGPSEGDEDELGEMGEGFGPSGDADSDDSDAEEDGSSSEGAGSDDDEADGSSDESTDGAGDEEGENSSSGDSDDDSGEKSSESNDASGSSNASSDENSADGVSGGQPWSETDTAQRDNEGTLVDDKESNVVYSQIPKDDAFNLDNIIIPHKQIFDTMTRYLAHEVSNENDSRYYPVGTDPIALARIDLKKFKNANAKVVNYLAKEFEMRKAADSSARAAISKTGVLDTTSLHSYKWNDDVFKKITVIPDGKSHGLVMFLDWSGSMHSNMPGSLDQILNLVMFCKKVNIPFDVYAFSDHTLLPGDYSFSRNEPMHRDKLVKGDYFFPKHSHSFRLMHLASSKGKTSEYNNMLLGLMMLRGHFEHGAYYAPNYNNASNEGYHYYPMPRSLHLGGTPLNEAVISAIPIVNKLRDDNNLQIVTTVFVTDGCGSELRHIWNPGNDEPRGWRSRNIIRDQKSKLEFAENGYEGQLAALLGIFRVRTGTKIVNFYITNPAPSAFKNVFDSVVKSSQINSDEGYRYGRRTATLEASAAFKVAKADGGVVIKDSLAGWDHYYLIMGGDSMKIKGDEGLDEFFVGAKKAALKKAFAKSASGKLRCRVVLRKFTELIAA